MQSTFRTSRPLLKTLVCLNRDSKNCIKGFMDDVDLLWLYDITEMEGTHPDSSCSVGLIKDHGNDEFSYHEVGPARDFMFKAKSSHDILKFIEKITTR